MRFCALILETKILHVRNKINVMLGKTTMTADVDMTVKATMTVDVTMSVYAAMIADVAMTADAEMTRGATMAGKRLPTGLRTEGGRNGGGNCRKSSTTPKDGMGGFGGAAVVPREMR